MKVIHFILNPKAGKGSDKIEESLLNKHFTKKEFTIVVKHTTYKKHAIKLTQESITEKADVIVACGGDGTINEVASCLIHSKIALGIIPLGSGNGLASNLKIPKNIENAISLIKKHAVKQIDVGQLNIHYFFSNTGIGFDAQVIKNYEASKERTWKSYIKATLKSLKKVSNLAEVETNFNGKTIHHKPFLIFISNSNQMGYKISLTPKASLQDGKLDVLIVKEISAFKIFIFTILMLFKSHHILSGVDCYQTKAIKITLKNKPLFQIQIDGEFKMIKNQTINISILEGALKVIA